MIGTLIWLLFFALLIYAVYLVVGMIGLPDPVRQIVCLILGIVFLLILLQQLGFVGGGGPLMAPMR